MGIGGGLVLQLSGGPAGVGLLVASQVEARSSGRVLRISPHASLCDTSIEAAAGKGSGPDAPDVSWCGQAQGLTAAEGGGVRLCGEAIHLSPVMTAFGSLVLCQSYNISADWGL